MDAWRLRSPQAVRASEVNDDVRRTDEGRVFVWRDAEVRIAVEGDDRATLNAAALRAVGYTKETPEPPGGEIVRDAKGNPTGLLLAKPNANILYATLAKGPKLPFDYQVNSTRHFMRELNRLGVTGAIDAGGGFQNYPEDYAALPR
jgi:predicted amidohydrolase YtcJ